MTDYRLSIWKHPKTGETRIYVNGGALSRNDKLYIFERNGDWDAKLWSDGIGLVNRGYGSNSYDIGLAIAEEALKERQLDRSSFSEIAAAL